MRPFPLQFSRQKNGLPTGGSPIISGFQPARLPALPACGADSNGRVLAPVAFAMFPLRRRNPAGSGFSVAGKSGRFGRSIGGAKKTGLSKRLVFCRACAGCRTGSGGAMPPRRNRRAPEPTSPLSDPRCLRRIRVWFCRTRRSPFSRYCLWRFSPSAFCRGTPRRPSAGRRSTTGSRRRP